MKLFNTAQIKTWDAYTIASEPIASIDLMERAATACYNWILQHKHSQKHFHIFCGKGNNGGDGLAIARLLIKNNYPAAIYILETGKEGSPDFEINLKRLTHLTNRIHFISSQTDFPLLDENNLLIDALFGSGLNNPLTGLAAGLVTHINQANARIISIDLPSGLFADKSSVGNTIITAFHTLSFQTFKTAFLLAENESFVGQITILDINLHKKYEETEDSLYEMTDAEIIKRIYKPRNKFSHKGTYGHAGLITGSIGLMGASTLAANGCLRSGVGKLTCIIPACGYTIMQVKAPEAMSKICGEECILSGSSLEKFDAVGIGPGIGLYESHFKLLKEIFQSYNKPAVIDADALNILSQQKELLHFITPGSILTPHALEFERLFGKTINNFDRLELALQKATEHKIFIILKAHHTFIATPDGRGFFNSTGNAGMATGGSGDVLTGIITGLLAQGYTSLDACILGVYLHGLAGDAAAQKFSEEAMIAGDIIECMGDAFRQIS